jgi:hypothetical protein
MWFAITLLGAVLALPITAGAVTITIDFSTIGAPGDTGSSSFVHGSGLTVNGYYFDDFTEDWTGTGANLYIRNEPNDHGLGVCSAPESPCPGPSGGGDINELDNEGAQELIRLSLPDGHTWVSVQLSSLDENDGSPNFEFGQLWADLDGDPASFDTVLWQFQGDDIDVEPLFLIPALAASSPYLFFQPLDWRPTGLNTNNDFLVYQATIQRPDEDVPEPASTSLIALGLLLIGGLRRKR